MKKIDLTGQKFGRLEVKKEAGRTKNGKILWLCKCDCGAETTVTGNHLKSKHTKSCGCLSREITRRRNTTHGMHDSPTYNSWCSIKVRCDKPQCKSFKNYGGRGIKVCEQWKSFGNFLADMGEKPEGMSIERIDNDGDYCPENCRWATRKEQNRNTRNNYMIKHQGKTKCIGEWAEELGVNYSILYSRLRRYPPEVALNM